MLTPLNEANEPHTNAVRALIWSDLHLEFESRFSNKQPPLFSLPDLPPDDTYDLIILAGDIGLVSCFLKTSDAKDDSADRLGQLFTHLSSLNKPVLFVLGNHEYYHSQLFGDLNEAFNRRLDVAGLHNIHLLNPGVFTLNGIHFLGATLWTDLVGPHTLLSDQRHPRPELKHQAREQYSQRLQADGSFNDLNQISLPQGKALTPDALFAAHEQDRRWLHTQMDALDEAPIVVITHHAPSFARYSQRGPMTGFWHKPAVQAATYASEMETWDFYQPLAWIHGHLHESLDYMIGSTRVVCNPRGYITDAQGALNHARVNPNFDPHLIITITTDPSGAPV